MFYFCKRQQSSTGKIMQNRGFQNSIPTHHKELTYKAVSILNKHRTCSWRKRVVYIAHETEYLDNDGNKYMPTTSWSCKK